MTTVEELEEFYEAHDDEFLKFERVQSKLSNRPDLHAFLLLEKLLPGEGDRIIGAEHDVIWLGVDVEQLLEVATEDQLLELHRCGVMYDSNVDDLSMYV